LRREVALGYHIDDIAYVVPTTYAHDGEFIYGHKKEGMNTGYDAQEPGGTF